MALDRFRTSLEQLHPQLEQVFFEISAEPAEFPERLSEARRNSLHNGVSNAKKRLKIEQDKKEPDAVKVSELEAAVRARMAERDRATERHRAWMRTPAGQEADAAWRARAVEKRRRVEASAAEEKGDSSRLSDKEIIDDLRARVARLQRESEQLKGSSVQACAPPQSMQDPVAGTVPVMPTGLTDNDVLQKLKTEQGL